jgi:hypothetical protein
MTLPSLAFFDDEPEPARGTGFGGVDVPVSLGPRRRKSGLDIRKPAPDD